MLIRLYKEVYDRNNTLVETVLVSEDFYPPIHRVEVRGLRSRQVRHQMNHQHPMNHQHQTKRLQQN